MKPANATYRYSNDGIVRSYLNHRTKEWVVEFSRKSETDWVEPYKSIETWHLVGKFNSEMLAEEAALRCCS
jgi:hypothetical protein